MTNTFPASLPEERRRWWPVLLLVIALHLMVIYCAFAPVSRLAPRAGGSGAAVTVELQRAPEAVAAPDASEQRVAVPAESANVSERELQPAASREQAAVGGGGGALAGGGNGNQAAGEALTQGTPGIEVPGTSVEEAMPMSASPGAGVVRGKVGVPNMANLTKVAVLPEMPRYQVAPLPSAELHFNGHAKSKGQEIHGNGLIIWQTDGNRYSIDGEFSVLFLSVLNFRSEGAIDREFGVAPLLYSEKRLRRSATNTHFQRERNLVSFSSSTKSYRRQGGEQDRASIIWQLAGIGRRDGAKFRSGAEFPLVVAGVRDAEIRTVRVVGLEEIESGLGKVKAWHLVHSRKPGSYEQTLDVWLAPEKDWYPVRLRYNEKNGDYLELKLAEIRPK